MRFGVYTKYKNILRGIQPTDDPSPNLNSIIPHRLIKSIAYVGFDGYTLA